MNKKELNLDDLSEVTGGFNNNDTCEHFAQARGKNQYPQTCENCYYHNIIMGQSVCTLNNNKQKGVA